MSSDAYGVSVFPGNFAGITGTPIAALNLNMEYAYRQLDGGCDPSSERRRSPRGPAVRFASGSQAVALPTTREVTSRMTTTRATFLRGDEVVSKLRSVLETLGRRLGDLRDAETDPDIRRVLSTIDSERRRILDETLSEYEHLAPASVLSRFSQYTVEVPNALLDPPDRRDGESLIGWTVAIVDRLSALFEQHAAHTESREAEELFSRLSEKLRAHGRKVSRMAADAFDIGLLQSPPRTPADSNRTTSGAAR